MNLKQIIVESGIGGFGETTTQPQKMTPEQKKELLSMVNQYNECGKQLYGYGDVRQIAERLLKVSELAEKYALEECNEDMLGTGNVHRDMKEVRKDASELHKIANDAWSINEKMKALYENVGKRLERYFEVN